MTHRLLAFSRRQTLDVKSFDVGALLGSLDDMLRRTLGEHIALDIFIVDGLWSCHADPGLLEQAIVNLANNARDAMAEGGRLSIRVANGNDSQSAPLDDTNGGNDDHVVISVTDTGDGMTEAVQGQMFESFSTTKPRGEGSGLGLSMVYGFVKQSRGQLAADSTPGLGTTVTLSLPRGRNAIRAAIVPARARAPETGRTILVVEHDDLRDVITLFLSKIGYRVLEAATGHKALALLREESHLDLLVTDIILPEGLNGIRLSTLVAEKFPMSCSLYMSGYPDGVLKHQGDLDPSFRALRKPFELDRLADEIRHTLAP